MPITVKLPKGVMWSERIRNQGSQSTSASETRIAAGARLYQRALSSGATGMTITELRAAAERCRRVEANALAQDVCWISRVYDPVFNEKATSDWNIDLRRVAAFASSFLSTDQINPEWLREKWNSRDACGDWRVEIPGGVVFVRFSDQICSLVTASQFGRFASFGNMNQGQFTALLFSLGQFPKGVNDDQ